MEQKIHDYFDQQTMPDGCVQRIEAQLLRSARPRRIRLRPLAAAAILVLILTVALNFNTLQTQASSFLESFLHQLDPDYDEPIGKLNRNEYIGYGALNKPVGTRFVKVIDGRLYFIGNKEHIDITDLCSEDTAYIYAIKDDTGVIHYLIIGGTPEDYGYAEIIYDPQESDCPWRVGYGVNILDPDNDYENRRWMADAKKQIGCPFL